MVLAQIFQALLPLMQGFQFGTGYGAGVRFGYEDVYPFFHSSAKEIMKFLGFTNANPLGMENTGFKMSSGITKQDARRTNHVPNLR